MNNDWSGNGSQNNPYIIANYLITIEESSGIYISNTKAYFIVMNVEANGTNNCCGGNAFHLNNVINGQFINNTATGNATGFRLEFSSNIVLSNNTATGNAIGFHLLSESNNNVLINNIAISNSIIDFYLNDC